MHMENFLHKNNLLAVKDLYGRLKLFLLSGIWEALRTELEQDVLTRSKKS